MELYEMTLGDGIVTATILVLLATGLYLIGQHRKWALAGKVVVGFVTLAVLIGFGAWSLDKYKNRPRHVTSFADLKLGMSPTDVKIILGAPSSEKADADDRELVLTYRNAYADRDELFLVFKKSDAGDHKLNLICDLSWPSLFGLTSSSSMDDVVRRLGLPTSERINEDKLSKLLIYENWNARFLIERNKVQGICVGLVEPDGD